MPKIIKMEEINTSIPMLFNVYEEANGSLLDVAFIIPRNRLSVDHEMVAFLSAAASEAKLSHDWYRYPEIWNKYVVMCVRDYREVMRDLFLQNDNEVVDGEKISRSFISQIDTAFGSPSLMRERLSTTVPNMRVIEMHEVH